MKSTLHLFSLITALLLGSSALAPAIVLISEDFSGSSSDNLNGKTPDVLNGALGSVTWEAGSIYKQDGSFAGDGAALIDLTATGTNGYVNDRKGTSGGLFTLTVNYTTPTQPNSSDFVTLGFYNTADPDLDAHPASGNTGLSWALWRVDGEVLFYEGPGNDGNEATDDITGAGVQTFIIDLDLTDWNDTDNWGSATMSYLAGGSTKTEIGTVEFTEDYSFDAVGLGVNDVTDGQVNSFELTVVPEPSAAALFLGVTGVLLLRRRRSLI